MSNTLQEMTLDLQTRIRELAYLMWESAGRHQGMAIEYWLKAESEVLTAMEAAAARVMPGSPTVSRPAGAGMSASPAREVATATPAEASAARGSASPEETRITAVDTPPPEPAPAPRQKAKPAARSRAGRAGARKDATA